MLSLLSRVIERPDVPIERMEQMFDLYTKVDAERARREFAKALADAQADMEPVRKNAYNPQTKSNYATFEALDRAIRPIYSRHGFAPTYRTEVSAHQDHVRVILTLIHIGGHERDYPADMPADGKGAKGGDVMTKTHAFGSAFSYGKRYTLGGAFNIITTERDDDGNLAGKKADANPHTVADLEDLIRNPKAKTTAAKICEAHSVGELSDLSPSQITRAVGILKKRIGG